MNSRATMLVPVPPRITRLDRISPTIYEAALRCISRAAWIASGAAGMVPQHPRALLGIGVHAVLQQARSGQLGRGTEEEQLKEAANSFDYKMEELFIRAHPLLVVKFGSKERLPFYNLYRARTARMAAEALAGSGAPASSDTGVLRAAGSRTNIEKPLVSKDGRIVGRPDVLDGPNATVVEYKTGQHAEATQITETEIRQLRLYAFLAEENGTPVRRGRIERADRTRAEVQISQKEAAEEGRRALTALEQYNSRAGGEFRSGASPSREVCRFCPCIPFCDAFWDQAEADWGSECGTHVEGQVDSIDGDALVSIHLNVARGSGTNGPAVITRLSREWLTSGESPVPHSGQTIRVTDAAYVSDTSSPAIFRADRVATAVWVVGDAAP